MNSIQFETRLFEMREQFYRHRTVDPVREGFRPVGGMLGDFCVIAHRGRYHFFAIERRLQEGTPFYPGHETYFCHASTADFVEWEVHDPVMWVRPGTWEAAHVWAPFVLRWRDRYVMAYTGVNRHGSQDIGLAFSDDLFEWERWTGDCAGCRGNPISPARGRPWAFWRTDGIASCRDPHLLIHDGRVYMSYTTNTREGASCIALASSADLHQWEDHGPILVGPADGYEPRLAGGHCQSQLESSNLLYRGNRWLLLVVEERRGTAVENWIYESDRMERFDYASGREFWPGAYTVEIVKERGSQALLACTGTIRFGIVDWSEEQPAGRFVRDLDELATWRDQGVATTSWGG